MTNFGLLRSVTTQEITRYVDQDESVEGDKIDDDVGDGDDDDDDDDDRDDDKYIMMKCVSVCNEK